MELLKKYNISETDLYTLALIEQKKAKSSFMQKEKLKAASMNILKAYNVKFLHIGKLINEIKKYKVDSDWSEKLTKEEMHLAEERIQELSSVSNFYSDWWKKSSKTQKAVVVISVIVLFGVIGNIGSGPKVNPCDCYSVFSKEKLMGFGNLSSTSKQLYNDCVKSWGNSKRANDGCLEKLNIN